MSIYIMDVIKNTGEKEPYEREKFCDSLHRAGAPADVTNAVCLQVEQELTPDISTNQIFRKASKYLMRQHFTAGVRYSVRRGIDLLGPAGFLFEQFIETLLRAEGFETKRNQFVPGECVTHEVDVLARKDGARYIIEAKYHNQSGTKTTIEPVMYGDARCEDIARRAKKEGDMTPHRLLVATNTKFSGNAIDYARCRQIDLIGWQYPRQRGLEDIIAEHLLYPVTSLPSVDRYARERFAQHGIMLVRDLAPLDPGDVARLGIDIKKSRVIVKQAHQLVYGPSHSEEGE